MIQLAELQEEHDKQVRKFKRKLRQVQQAKVQIEDDLQAEISHLDAQLVEV